MPGKASKDDQELLILSSNPLIQQVFYREQGAGEWSGGCCLYIQLHKVVQSFLPGEEANHDKIL
jgi:hypothetical protein